MVGWAHRWEHVPAFAGPVRTLDTFPSARAWGNSLLPTGLVTCCSLGKGQGKLPQYAGSGLRPPVPSPGARRRPFLVFLQAVRVAGGAGAWPSTSPFLGSSCPEEKSLSIPHLLHLAWKEPPVAMVSISQWWTQRLPALTTPGRGSSTWILILPPSTAIPISPLRVPAPRIAGRPGGRLTLRARAPLSPCRRRLANGPL